MPRVFKYRARSLSGRVVSGRVEADSQSAAILLLREKNLFVVDIRPESGPSFNLRKLLGLKIKTRDLAVFCRQFATMSEAGIPLLRCLHILVQQTESKPLRRVLEDVLAGVQKGKGLSEAFSAHKDLLPEILINMVAAGEVGGTLDQALGRLAVHFEKENELREKIKSAMTYPLLVTGMAFLAVIALLIIIVPIFVDIFNQMGATLPLPTRILIGVSSFLIRYWYALPIMLGALFLGARRLLATEGGKRVFDQMLIRLPVFGALVQKGVVARCARTLATLLRSGVPLIKSLETVEKVAGNTLAAREIAAARESIREGERIAPVLANSQIFPPMAVNMIAVGEESGNLDDLLEKLALFYDQEVEATVARLSSLVEPFLIAGVGLVVAFIAISIYLPLFSMAGAMQGGAMSGSVP
ncbi:Type II secretion system F domain protein [Desulfofundulus kuznetsovii DSM 6115]|uniref:Type II secretion system F domain protein n=1 Tax=Desulfofundulus kuznetsovii (strain DSM 6115 / VKM B-1805 / 17) TaxID=760568 RepID=A0AAU8PBW4_DESK7|nr:Type II secretion system F domain protein [Desulfofundulus kuznetsovii DSM 6115]